MSGNNQVKERNHFIPQLLLRRFASRIEGKKAWVWQYRQPAKPIEISTKDAAVGRFFYGKPETGIEDALTPHEVKTAELFTALDKGADPNQFTEDLQRLVWLLYVRTKSFRRRLLKASNGFVEVLLDELCSGENELKLRKKILPRMDAQFLEKARALPYQQQKYLLANRRLLMAKMPLRSFVEEIVSGFLAEWSGASEEAVESGQIKGMQGLLPEFSENTDFLEVQNWKLVTSNEQNLVLGDSCVFALTNGEVRSLEKLHDKVVSSAIFLPISGTQLLVGVRRGDDPSLPVDKVNLASVRQSSEMFFASKMDPDLANMVGQMGASSDLLARDEMKALVAEIWGKL